jgi:hypothetical protein
MIDSPTSGGADSSNTFLDSRRIPSNKVNFFSLVILVRDGLNIMIKHIGSHAAKESLAETRPDPVPSKLVIHSENKTDVAVIHLPSPVSPDVIDRSPAVLLHSATRPTERPNFVNSFSLTHPEPLSNGPGGTRSSHDGPIFEEAAPLSISQPFSPSDTTDATSMMRRQAMGNGTSRTDGDLQLGEQHLVIDSGPAGLVLQDATVNPASQSDGYGVHPGEHHVAIDVEPATMLVRVGAEVTVTGSDHL